MKEEGDVFKKFRDSFSKMDGHFHILEQRVPVELQMEYFKYSEQVRKERAKPDLNDMDYTAAKVCLIRSRQPIIRNIFYPCWQLPAR